MYSHMTTCPVCQLTNDQMARFCSGCGFELVSPDPLTPAAVLQGRYRVLEKIGGGGMSTVYRAADTRLGGALRAVKCIKITQRLDPAERFSAVESFRHEAEILARLDHPNLPRVYDWFSEGGQHYLVMDYVDGWNLRWILENRPDVLTEQRVVNRIIQLCDVLAYLHSQPSPIIFRDLKPDNIMITRSGLIKLIDFGIARFFAPRKSADTQTMGTEGYAAPEQYGRAQTDARSDIYSLGVVFHELLTRNDPCETPFNLPPVCQLNARVSPAIQAIIQHATSLEPEARFSSALELKAALLQGTLPSVEASDVSQGEARKETPDKFEDERFGRVKRIKIEQESGEICLEKRQFQKAIAHFTEAIILGSQDEASYGCRGIAYWNTGQTDLAIADFTEAIKRNPLTPSGYLYRGMVHHNLDQLDDAISDYTMAIANDSSLQSAYYNRGLASLNLGKAEQAFIDFGRVIALDPSSAGAYYNRGLASLDLGEAEQAIADFGQVIALNPEEANAYFWRGTIFASKGEREHAIHDYSQAIALEHHNADAIHQRAITYAELGMLEAALTDFTKVIDLNPRFPRVYVNRGLAYGQSGQHQLAIEDFTQALVLEPSDDHAYYNRGVAYRSLGEWDKAMSDFSQAIVLDPQNIDAYISRGFAYVAQGRDGYAVADLEKALTLDPDPYWKERIERALTALKSSPSKPRKDNKPNE